MQISTTFLGEAGLTLSGLASFFLTTDTLHAKAMRYHMPKDYVRGKPVFIVNKTTHSRLVPDAEYTVNQLSMITGLSKPQVFSRCREKGTIENSDLSATVRKYTRPWPALHKDEVFSASYLCKPIL